MMATRSSFVKKKKEGRRECLVSKKSLSFILFYFLAAISPISCCCHRFTCAVVHCVPTILNKRYGYDVLSLVDRRSNHRWTKMMISLYINENNNGMNYSSERRRKSHLELRGGDGGGVSSEHDTYSGHESQRYYTADRGGKVSLSIPPSKEQNVESAAKSNEQSPFEYIPITLLMSTANLPNYETLWNLHRGLVHLYWLVSAAMMIRMMQRIKAVKRSRMQ